MDGQPTRAGANPRIPGRWTDFLAFLRHPALPERPDLGLRGGLAAIVRLLALDILAMIVVLGGFGVATAMGMEMPGHMLENLALGPVLIAFIVLGGPISEEIVFRSWLSGRPGHLAAIATLAAGAVVAGLVASQFIGQTRAIVGAGTIAAACLAALAIAWTLRRRPALGWFRRHFGWFYYASALAFAGIHLSNFVGGEGNVLATLPLTLPQFALGLLLGYLRVHRGLWASMVLHALHNALFVALMLAGNAAGI